MRQASVGVARRRQTWLLGPAVAALLTAISAWSGSPPARDFNIPSEDMGSALEAFSRASGIQILYSPSILTGLHSSRLKGTFDVGQALSRLLARSGLTCRTTATGVWLIEKAPPPPVPPIATQAALPPPAAPTVQVVVYGIRGALDQGLESKRRSISIVESVQSEDIGKMPDANIAEALQRVAGIAIDRDGGEGRYVSIRGFGPSFNTVLLNGRDLATSEESRAFGFDTISSDLVSGINLYKTQASNVPDGGVGGTVDLRTAHALDRKGPHLSLRLGHSREGNDGRTSAQASFVLSDTFLNDRLGLLLSGSYQQRDNRTYEVSTSLLRTRNAFAIPSTFSGGTGTTGTHWIYGNFGVKTAMVQQELDRNVLDERRTRTGLYGNIQYKPVDDAEFNIDYLYSRFDVDTNLKQVGNWLYELMPPASSAASILAIDPSDPRLQAYAGYVRANSHTQVDANGVVTQAQAIPGLGTQAFNGELDRRPTVTQMLGLNYKWHSSDALKFTLDTAYSTAALNNPGLNERRSLEDLSDGTFTYDNTGSVPFVSGLTPSLSANLVDTSHLFFRRNYDYGTMVKAANAQAGLEAEFAASAQIRFRFGILGEQKQKSNTDYETPLWVSQFFANANTTALTPAQLSRLTYGVYASAPAKFGMAKTADNDTFLLDFAAMDAFALDSENQALLSVSPSQRAAFNAYAAANGGPFAAIPSGAGYKVRERIVSIYADMTRRMTLLNRPAVLAAGLRYARTATLASAYSQVITNLAADPADSTQQNLLATYADGSGPGGLSYARSSRTYGNLLPSAALKLNATDNIVLRLGASQSLSRPDLDQLAPQTTYATLTTSQRIAYANNPDLHPLVSTNLDAAAEWYRERDDAATVEIFWKNLNGFITKQSLPDVVVSAVQPTQYDTFTVVRPSNAATAKVWGATIGWTHGFASGLGFQTNYTWTATNRKFNPLVYDPSKVALPGLSDNFNAIVYYERDTISARVAYNWRSKFLSDPGFPAGIVGDQLEPVFTRASGQVDARISLAIKRNLQLYVDGTNLTNSPVVKVGRFNNLFISRDNYGSRIAVGVQYRY